MARLTIPQIEAALSARGFSAVNLPEALGLTTPIRVRCQRGHVILVAAGSVLDGLACTACTETTRCVRQLEELQAVAMKRGGKLLSTDYINSKTKLQWECREGHQWRAIPSAVKSRTWCPVCGDSVAHTIQEIQALAQKRGGRLLSQQYRNNKTPLDFECAQGHRFSLKVNHLVSSGSWCRICNGSELGNIEMMKRLARSRGGLCLSAQYTNSETPLRWKCRAGHVWAAPSVSVKNNQTWCGKCAGVAKLDLNAMNVLARSKGLRCLSEHYKGNKEKLRWRCKLDHEFMSRPNDIQSGFGCPECGKESVSESKRLGIDAMQKLARKHGGKCLASHYQNTKTPMPWVCAQGHGFQMTASAVKDRGRWCPVCRSGG